jgi:hypothetical protein
VRSLSSAHNPTIIEPLTFEKVPLLLLDLPQPIQRADLFQHRRFLTLLHLLHGLAVHPEDIPDRVELGGDEPALRASLHRFVLALPRFEVRDVLLGSLLHHIGGDAVPCLLDIAEGEGVVRLGREDVRDAEVRDAGSESLLSGGSCYASVLIRRWMTTHPRTSPGAHKGSPRLQAQDRVIALPRALHRKVGVHEREVGVATVPTSASLGS